MILTSPHHYDKYYFSNIGGSNVTTGNNDHRVIGRQLGLFHVQDDAAGSIFWHPNGWKLYRIIENYIRDILDQNGYQEVRTPQLYQKNLWEKSGHLDHYHNHIYSTKDDMLLKPMNCPAHVQIFNSHNISYKQLPLRLAEFGCCHRNEDSGALNGLFRVRQFVQDDAHIFCAMEQVENEINDFCKLLDIVYKKFGFEYSVAISLRPDDKAGDDDLWDKAESYLIDVIQKRGIPFKLLPKEGAFYGPKLEFSLKDSRGREWQCGTAQLDFILPKRLGAKYIGEDGKHHYPVMIHRAILGSLERFIAILLEHTNGNLPIWLAPIPMVVINVGEPSADYAFDVFEKLHQKCNRVQYDNHIEKNMMGRVKEWLNQGVPYVIVIGQKEMDSGKIALRARNDRTIKQLDLDEVIGYF